MLEFFSRILPTGVLSPNRRGLKRYTLEAKYVATQSRSMTRIPSESLTQNFQNLRGRTDREALLLAFAIVVELSNRFLGMRPYEVQIVGALAMCDGQIVEMATGEGKTLTAALALAWHGLHGCARAMTVNSYLAKRDAILLSPLYEALGLSTGYIQESMGKELRLQAYQSSVVYGTSSEFVFDYLRDNLVYDYNQLLQLTHGFIIIDEADSILIDEARTPLVLSGEGTLDASLWTDLRDFVATLSYQTVKEDTRTQLERSLLDKHEIGSDIGIENKHHDAFVSEQAISKVEEFFIAKELIATAAELWQPSKSYLWRALIASVKARLLFHRDKDYIVRDGKVVIIDQETGRLSKGKRWGEGVHQAIECKEQVAICAETIELGRIALANYMSLYSTVGGMTGTAATVAKEIQDLYGLNVIAIPTHKPLIRKDLSDLVFTTKEAKLNQMVEDAKLIHAKGQPILIGTGSVEDSEILSARFTAAKLPHNVLNAKQDEAEASVIAQAGRLGAITIATSMAGRGTDIILGGHTAVMEDQTSDEVITSQRQQVLDAGGLFVMGSERLDDRRLDKQLAGRSGRQGDPGASQFYISLEDSLMQNFGGETLKAFFAKVGVGDDDSVQHAMVDRSTLMAQRLKQSIYYESRKTGLRQDSVIDMPRKVIYAIRKQTLLLTDEEALALIKEQIGPNVDRLLAVYCDDFVTQESDWDLDGLKAKLHQWGLAGHWFDNLYGMCAGEIFQEKRLRDELNKWINFDLTARIPQGISKDADACRLYRLMAIDNLWRAFLEESELIRTGIHLRSFANEKPDLALKREVYKLFQKMQDELPVVTLDFAYGSIRQAEMELDAGQPIEAA